VRSQEAGGQLRSNLANTLLDTLLDALVDLLANILLLLALLLGVLLFLQRVFGRHHFVAIQTDGLGDGPKHSSAPSNSKDVHIHGVGCVL
jgi:hypothetical protein